MMTMTEQTKVIAAISDPGRLAIVRATNLLDSGTEEAFDRLTRLAAKLTGAPVTFVSIVDEDRDFYKSCFGFPEPLASERQMTGTTFCHYALVSDGPLVIENTIDHPIYRNVPTVESLGVRAYLGVPLVTSTGHAIGSFCAIDFKPRPWTKLDIEVLQELAASTLREIELRMAVQTLDDERRRLAVLLQHIPAGIVFGEAPSGRIVIRNRHAEQIIGEAVIASPTVEGYSEWVGFRPDGSRVEPAEWPLAKALRGEIVRNDEVLYQRRDGRSVWIRIHAAPVRDADGTILGGIVAFYDIDEERTMRMENVRLYEETRRANRAKDDFFAAVTHELRTPMTAIIGWAHLLKMEQFDNPHAIEAANAIADSAMLQAQLVDDLLDVSRIATGKLSLHREPIDLNEVAQQAVQAVQPAAESNGLRLHVSLGDACVIDADRGRIRQIVGNLLSNAIKFTPTGGLIELTSSVHDGFATLAVRDTGRGIEASLLPHIFERFQQAKSAELGGLGLGLTIVRHLVEMHGGDVRAESEGAGKGATFTVRLPLADRV
jgi:PAS domain S-box-containing protein